MSMVQTLGVQGSKSFAVAGMHSPLTEDGVEMKDVPNMPATAPLYYQVRPILHILLIKSPQL